MANRYAVKEFQIGSSVNRISNPCVSLVWRDLKFNFKFNRILEPIDETLGIALRSRFWMDLKFC